MKQKISSFLEYITRLFLRQLPLFVMLAIYTTIPTFFTTTYSYKTYLMIVLPQVVLPSLLLCFIADRRRWLWWTIFIFANLLWLVEMGCHFCQDERMYSHIAILIAQSNARESGEYLITAYPSILKALLTTAACAASVYICDRYWRRYSGRLIMKLKDGPRRSIMKYAGLLLVVSSIYSPIAIYKETCKDKGYWKRIESARYYSTCCSWIMYAYALTDVFDNPDLKMTPKLIEAITSADVTFDNTNDSLTIVYVIGESFSRHRSSLYAYPYDTNPLMTKELADSSLIIFDNAISLSYYTYVMYRNMLSAYDPQGGSAFEYYPLLPALMKKAGYKVAYFDNQSLMANNKIDLTTSYFLNDKEIRDLCFDCYNIETQEYDGDFINSHPPVTADNGANSLTIYHLTGQHCTYRDRYPESFTHFTKDDYSGFDGLSEEGATIMSDYDNATRYNDYVIHSIIERLRDKNAVLIYAPDHGEEAYDYREHYGRYAKTPPIGVRVLNEVPVMIWTSDRFRKKYPEKVTALRKNTGKAIYNSDLPHTILDIAGIGTSTFNPDVSLLREGKGREHRHLLIHDIDYDASRNEIDSLKLRYEK